MEKAKFVLEKIVKIIIITGSIMGIISTILFLKFKINYWPTIITYYPQELILFLCMIGVFLLAIRFEVKYFKWIILVGIILSGIDLMLCII